MTKENTPRNESNPEERRSLQRAYADSGLNVEMQRLLVGVGPIVELIDAFDRDRATRFVVAGIDDRVKRTLCVGGQFQPPVRRDVARDTRLASGFVEHLGQFPGKRVRTLGVPADHNPPKSAKRRLARLDHRARHPADPPVDVFEFVRNRFLVLDSVLEADNGNVFRGNSGKLVHAGRGVI